MREGLIEELAELWRKLLGKEPAKGSRKHFLYKYKVKLLEQLPAGILRGEEGQEFSREELERVLEPFRAKLPAQTCLFLIRFLSRGLSKGKRTLNWKIAVPSVPQNIPRERARFTPQKFAEIQKLRRIEEAFLRSFSSDAELKTEHILGRVILSAIIYGGLLQSQWLNPFAVAANKRVSIDGSSLWLDLERTWIYRHTRNKEGVLKFEEPITIYRRWFADPVTKILILRWRLLAVERNYSNGQPNAFDLVMGFLVAIGLPNDHLPKNVTNLLSMAETRLGLVVSPFLTSYASDWLHGVSVPRETWARLCTGKIVEREPLGSQEDKSEQPSESPLPVFMTSKTAPLSEQQKLLRAIQNIFRRSNGFEKSKPQLRSELAELLEQTRLSLCPLLALLISWINNYLAVESRYSPATPKRYLGAIGKILLAVFGQDDVLELEEEDFIECYDRAVEIVKSDKEKGTARSTIGRFHNYLVRRHGAPHLWQGFFHNRSGPAEVTVNANLVTQKEFDRIKDALGWGNGKRNRTATAAILVAIFGFRCGLRRNEVHKLRVHDIQGHTKPELLLRATAKRRLKSANATRRLPLHLLLPRDEMELLRFWLEQFDNPSRETLLFCMDPVNRPWELIPETLLFNKIGEALVMATGDRTLHFHHLRHSFANWLLIRLTGDVNNLRRAASFLDHPEFSDVRIQELRSFLLGNEHLGRKGAYAVSSLLGHAEVETTFTRYIHLCDWLLGRELSIPSALPTIDDNQMAGLTGLSRATTYRAYIGHKNTPQQPCWDFELLFRKMVPSGTLYRDPSCLKAKMPVIERLHIPDRLLEVPLWLSVQKALRLFQERDKSVPEIAELLYVSEELVNSWLERTYTIMCMRHDNRDKFESHDCRLRHVNTRLRPPGSRTMLRNKDHTLVTLKRHHNRTQNHVFPKQPVEEGDKSLAAMILNRFDRLPASDKTAVFDAVDYFLEKYSVHKGIIIFTGTRQAREFLNSIGYLGVKGDLIQLVALSRDNKGDLTNTRKALWEKDLGLKEANWGVSDRGYASEKSPGAIGVRVLTPKGGKNQKGSYGFRYALYLIAIAYWN